MLTTVGYGDIYPILIGGKMFTFVLLLLGLGVVATPTTLFAPALNEVREEEYQKTTNDKKESLDIQNILLIISYFF